MRQANDEVSVDGTSYILEVPSIDNLPSIYLEEILESKKLAARASGIAKSKNEFKLDHIEVLTTSSKTKPVTLPPHLQERAAKFAKERETAEELNARLAARDASRMASIAARKANATAHLMHADTVRARKEVMLISYLSRNESCLRVHSL